MLPAAAEVVVPDEEPLEELPEELPPLASLHISRRARRRHVRISRIWIGLETRTLLSGVNASLDRGRVNASGGGRGSELLHGARSAVLHGLHGARLANTLHGVGS